MSKHDSSTAAIGEKPWIGVDFDGTLATYEGWSTQGRALGRPIWPMVNRVKIWLAKGTYDVRIVTARAHAGAPQREHDIALIKEWCAEFIGRELPVTAEKDFSMFALWDDRVINVDPNEGELGYATDLVKGCYE